MKLQTMVLTVAAVCLGITILTPPHRSSAEPILKPKKYAGPIPNRFFTFDIGVLGGAENEDMWNFLDRQIDQPLRDETETNDFGASLALGASYTVKVHPHFALRTKAGLAILGSDSKGLDVPSVEADSLRPLLRFERQFDVLLFSVDGTALYFFQDASVKEFQSYAGGGFSLYFPYAKYTEDTTDEDTGQPYGSSEQSDWSFQPGIHAILGFLYHINPTVAFNMEGRGQMTQSKFELNYMLPSGEQPLSFDVDYTGFVITAGISKFF